MFYYTGAVEIWLYNVAIPVERCRAVKQKQKHKINAIVSLESLFQ